VSDAGFITAMVGCGTAIVAAGAGAMFSAATKRREDERRRFGERIGVLERFKDHTEGYNEGFRDGRAREREEVQKGHDRR
jgi:hypothetical protein